MKLFILFLFFPILSYSNPVEKTLQAFSKTKKGKEINKKVTKELKVIPENLKVFASVGIKQEIQFKLNKNNNLKLDYRKKEVSYIFQYKF